MRNTTTVMAVLGLALTTVACDRLPTTPPEQYIGGAQEAQTRLDKGPLGTLGASRFRGGGVLALAEEFGLTSEQVAEIEAIVAEAGARTEPILEQLRARARQDGFPPGPREGGGLAWTTRFSASYGRSSGTRRPAFEAC